MDDALPRPSPDLVASMLHILEHGGEQARRDLMSSLASLDANTAAKLREKLIEQFTSPAHSQTKIAPQESWTTSWRISALVIVAGQDSQALALMERYSQREFEINPWIRYWTLVTAYSRPEHNAWLKQKAQHIAKDGQETLLVRCFAWAFLIAVENHPALQSALHWALQGAQDAFPSSESFPAPAVKESPEKAKEAGLRALREIPLPAFFDEVRSLVDHASFASYTWDAIWALGKYVHTNRAEEASHTLARFIVTHRRAREYYDLVGLAIKAIGYLGVKQTELLTTELDSGSPAIAFEAAQALERLLGTESAVEHILSVAIKMPEQEGRLAAALRHMHRREVVEQLASYLQCGDPQRETSARKILVELGGSEAMSRVQMRQQDLGLRRKIAAELDLRQRSHVKWITLGDGIATWIAVGMWVIIFLIGIIILVSGTWLLYQEKGIDSWSTWVLTASGGFLAALSKLRFNGRMVEATGARAAARLAIFSGYQRKLQQIDLVLAQRFIDGQKIPPSEAKEFSDLVSKAQVETQQALLELIPSVSKTKSTSTASSFS